MIASESNRLGTFFVASQTNMESSKRYLWEPWAGNMNNECSVVAWCSSQYLKPDSLMTKTNNAISLVIIEKASPYDHWLPWIRLLSNEMCIHPRMMSSIEYQSGTLYSHCHARSQFCQINTKMCVHSSNDFVPCIYRAIVLYIIDNS